MRVVGQYRPCSLLSCFRSWLGVQVGLLIDEYMALKHVVVETVWIRDLLTEMELGDLIKGPRDHHVY